MAVLGAAAAGTITWLGAVANREERTVTLLAETARLVDDLGELPAATASDGSDLRSLLVALERSVDDLGDRVAEPRFEALTDLYADELQSPDGHAEVVDPLGEQIAGILTEESSRARERAEMARARSVMGTWVLVLGAVGLVAALAARLRRQTRLAERADAARRADDRLRRLVAASPEFVLVVRFADGVITYVSPAAHAALGVDAGATRVGALVGLLDPVDLEHVAGCIERIGDHGATARFECRVHLGGAVRVLDCTITNHRDDPEIAGVVVNAVDVTERTALTDHLTHQASHDALTGLANRPAFLHRIEQAVAAGRSVAVLLVDLDGFKEINDTLGHPAGDRVLVTVAARLATLVRQHDIVGRLDGDEFGIALVDTDAAGARSVARRVLDTVAGPMDAGAATEALLTASVGIALALPGLDAGTLVRRADAAVHEAKEAGRARSVVYAPELEARFAQRVELRAAIERGLANREFLLQYQPVHAVGSNDLVAFESLLRWQRPDGTFMNPGEFLPVAESSGQIVPLGRWVVHAAMRQLGIWHQLQPGLGMAINVSPRQLGEPGFVEEVRALLESHRLDPASITFEVTETMLVDDPERTAERLRALKALGVRLAIDDYGAGNAAIGFLLRFPIDVVKFDRQLIASLDDRPVESEALIRSITGLAHAIGLETVAEGIERPDQLQRVAELGCTTAQGYHLARPMFPDRAERYLLAHSALTTP